MRIDTTCYHSGQSLYKILIRVKENDKRKLKRSLIKCEWGYKNTLDKGTREFGYIVIYNKLKRLGAI